MTIKHKKNGAYADIVGMQFKKNGTYAAVVGAFVKVNGVYQNVLSGGGNLAYKGITATRNALPNTYASTGAVKYMQNRIKKTATSAMTQVEMWFTNITPVGTTEIPGGLGTMAGTIDSASIEYPAGTFTRATFAGQQVGTFVGGPQILVAIAPVAIPEGADYYEWNLCNWTSTYSPNYSDGMNNSINPLSNISGEMSQTSANPLTDYTMTGTGMTNTAFQGTSYRAAAHVGTTTKDAYALFADSKGRAALSWDSNLDTKGFKGEVGRGLEKRAAIMNLGVNGDSYANVTTDNAYLIRAQFAALCNKAIDCLGTNDLGTGATISKAQFETYISQFKTKLNWGSKPYLKATITPRSTTTDNGMTTANQTPVASNASRIALNDALRAGTVAGVTGFVEIADAVETARNSGILIVPAGARVITDAQSFGSNGMNSTVTNWTNADIGKLVLGQSGGAAVITNLQTAVLARASSFFGTFGPNGTAYVGIPAFGPPGSDLLHLSPAMELLIANSSAFDFAGPVVR